MSTIDPKGIRIENAARYGQAPVHQHFQFNENVERITNGDVETNLNDWTIFGSHSVARINGDGVGGSACCAEVVSSGGTYGDTNSVHVAYTGIVSGSVYTIQFSAKSVSGSTDLRIGYGATTYAFTITTAWAQYSIDVPLTSAASSYIAVGLNAAGTCRIDKVSIKKASDFSIGVWFRQTVAPAGWAGGLCGIDAYLKSGFRMGVIGSTGKLLFWSTENGGTVEMYSPAAVSSNVWHLAIISVQRGQYVKMYLDGVLQVTNSSPTAFASFDTTQLNVGAINANSKFCGDVGEFIVQKDEAVSAFVASEWYAGGIRWNVSTVGYWRWLDTNAIGADSGPYNRPLALNGITTANVIVPPSSFAWNPYRLWNEVSLNGFVGMFQSVVAEPTAGNLIRNGDFGFLGTLEPWKTSDPDAILVSTAYGDNGTVCMINGLVLAPPVAPTLTRYTGPTWEGVWESDDVSVWCVFKDSRGKKTALGAKSTIKIDAGGGDCVVATITLPSNAVGVWFYANAGTGMHLAEDVLNLTFIAGTPGSTLAITLRGIVGAVVSVSPTTGTGYYIQQLVTLPSTLAKSTLFQLLFDARANRLDGITMKAEMFSYSDSPPALDAQIVHTAEALVAVPCATAAMQTHVHPKVAAKTTKHFVVQLSVDFTIDAVCDVDKFMMHIGTVPVKNWEAHTEDSVESRSIGLAAYLINQLFEIHSSGKILLKASVFGKLNNGSPTSTAVLDATNASANAEPQTGVGGQNSVPSYKQYE